MSGKIIYDDRPIKRAALVDASDIFSLGAKSIEAENIGSVSEIIAGDLSVIARKIDYVGSFIGRTVIINAQEVTEIDSFAALRMAVTAHEVSEMKNFGAGVCASVQTLGSIHDMGGNVSVFGRTEKGVASHIGQIVDVVGVASLHDVDVDMMGYSAVQAQLENSHLKHLGHGVGSVKLIDSTIDEVSEFTGKIYLHGNSSVGSRHDNIGLEIIKD